MTKNIIHPCQHAAFLVLESYETDKKVWDTYLCFCDMEYLTTWYFGCAFLVVFIGPSRVTQNISWKVPNMRYWCSPRYFRICRVNLCQHTTSGCYSGLQPRYVYKCTQVIQSTSSEMEGKLKAWDAQYSQLPKKDCSEKHLCFLLLGKVSVYMR